VKYKTQILFSVISFVFSFIACSCNLFNSSKSFVGSKGKIYDSGLETIFPLEIHDDQFLSCDSNFGLEEVSVSIIHPCVSDLLIFLESPSGILVELSSVNGNDGDNYFQTRFSHFSQTNIVNSKAPFSGTFLPEGFLGSFNNGDNPNGTWKLIIKDWKAFKDSGELISWGLKFGKKAVPPISFTSTNLPVVKITTYAPINDTLKTEAELEVTEQMPGKRNYLNDYPNVYNGKVKIEYRGSSSQMFAKKSFNFETVNAKGKDEIISLLDMPEENEWILYAPYPDKTLLRNFLSYHLSNEMGNYASRGKFVELFIDNQYQGVYILMEKIKIGDYRLNICAIDKDCIQGDELTGGYILKIDKKTGASSSGWYSQIPANVSGNKKVYFQVHYPRKKNLIPEQKSYIKSFVDRFEKSLISSSFKDPVIGYKKYIDINSFIDFFIINELSKNIDAYRVSTYLYKDRDTKNGKLHIGPIWDFDLAWRNADFGNAFDYTGWQYELADTSFPGPIWWHRFMEDEDFVNQLNIRWNVLRKDKLNTDYLYSFIDSTTSYLNEAQQRNFTCWPVLGYYVWPNPNPLSATYKDEVYELKKWITNRLQWMDENIPKPVSVHSVSEMFAR